MNDRTSASDFDFALPPLSDRVVGLPQDGSTKQLVIVLSKAKLIVRKKNKNVNDG